MPRPNTSVRPPRLAGVRGRKLSDLLRVWRSQPRKRSPVLFWGLVALAVGIDAAILVLGARLPGSTGSASAVWPSFLASDAWLRLQMLLWLSACMALVSAWAVATLTLGRFALAPPDGERLRHLAALCVRAVAVALVLLVAGTILGVVRAARPGCSPPGWDAPALGTLFALPCCAALLFVRRAGWLPPAGLLMAWMLGFTAVVLAWQIAASAVPAACVGEVVLVNIALMVHAALRYYFGRQRVCGS